MDVTLLISCWWQWLIRRPTVFFWTLILCLPFLTNVMIFFLKSLNTFSSSTVINQKSISHDTVGNFIISFKSNYKVWAAHVPTRRSFFRTHSSVSSRETWSKNSFLKVLQSWTIHSNHPSFWGEILGQLSCGQHSERVLMETNLLQNEVFLPTLNSDFFSWRERRCDLCKL